MEYPSIPARYPAYKITKQFCAALFGNYPRGFRSQIDYRSNKSLASFRTIRTIILSIWKSYTTGLGTILWVARIRHNGEIDTLSATTLDKTSRPTASLPTVDSTNDILVEIERRFALGSHHKAPQSKDNIFCKVIFFSPAVWYETHPEKTKTTAYAINDYSGTSRIQKNREA